MSSTQDIEPFTAPIAALNRVLTRFGDKGMIIGGVAASLLGTLRVTADGNALILPPLQDLPELIEAAEQEGLELRFDDAEIFARQHRMLLLRHTASGINVDISLGMLPFEEEPSHEARCIKSVISNCDFRRPKTSLFSRR